MPPQKQLQKSLASLKQNHSPMDGCLAHLHFPIKEALCLNSWKACCMSLPRQFRIVWGGQGDGAFLTVKQNIMTTADGLQWAIPWEFFWGFRQSWRALWLHSMLALDLLRKSVAVKTTPRKQGIRGGVLWQGNSVLFCVSLSKCFQRMPFGEWELGFSVTHLYI